MSDRPMTPAEKALADIAEVLYNQNFSDALKIAYSKLVIEQLVIEHGR